jgi:hypothetical protein
MKYVYVENGVVKEDCQNNPANLFSPEHAAKFVQTTDDVQQGWSEIGGVFYPPIPVAFGVIKATFITQVKAEAGALITQVLSGLGSEYELAEKDAIAYKAAGYPATIPSSVQSEVNSKAAKGVTITATVACDTILAAAASWRRTQAALRDKRLTVTSAASVTDDVTGLDVLKASWAGFFNLPMPELGA